MNASKWFYQEPEPVCYLISERVNSTFWQARIYDVYWNCETEEPPYRVTGTLHGLDIEMEWVPKDWLRIRAELEADLSFIVRAVSERILGHPATLRYENDMAGMQIYEWHIDGGQKRWSEIQGRVEFSKPKLLG